MACHEREVDLAHSPTLELIGQVRVSALVLGNDDETGRVLIETVNYSGTALPADTLDVGRMGKDGIGEGVVFVSRGRMYCHPCGLVDDDEVFVLEHDGERNVPRLQFCRRWRWDFEGD